MIARSSGVYNYRFRGGPPRGSHFAGALMPPYQHVKVPAGGQKITVNKDFSLNVSDHPIIPFIEGDGTGIDITPVMIKVVDAAVAKAYGAKRKIHWMEIYAGEKSTKIYGPDVWLPEESLAILKEYVVSIKGPLTTPVGGGIRSLNVALRQELDLYVCLRPVRYVKGVPSPVKRPEDVDMVIFRENTEDIYAGIEWAAGTPEVKKVVSWLRDEMKVKKIRFPETSGLGIKPVSREGTERLVRAALRYALDFKRNSLSLVHKGNIMKFTEGAFRDWGYALAARVGGIGIAPGGNINYETGHAIFEATHGTAPKYADLDKVNPGSVILSGCMMLRYLGWREPADAIENALERTIGQKRVTYDFERQMEGAKVLKTSEFAAA